MDAPRRPVPAQSETELLALSDDIAIDVERVKNTNERRSNLESADVSDTDIPVDQEEVTEELEEELLDILGEPPDNEGQGDNTESSNDTNDDIDDSKSSKGSEGGSGEDSGGNNGLGSGGESGPDDDASGTGKSTDGESPSQDSGSGSSDSVNNSTSVESSMD